MWATWARLQEMGQDCGKDGGETGEMGEWPWGPSDVVRAGWNLAPRSGKGWSTTVPCLRLRLRLRLLL